MQSLHDKVIKFYASTGNLSMTARQYSMHVRTVKKIVNNVPRKKRSSKFSKEDSVAIEAIIAAEPQLYFEEIQEKLFCRTHTWISPTSLFRICKEIGITRKKLRTPAVERFSPVAMTKRLNYLSTVADYPPQQRFFVDETGIDQNTFYRRFGRNIRGIRAEQIRRYVRTIRYTILSCIGANGLIGFSVIEGSANSKDFDEFIINVVMPSIPQNSAIILDNASIHQSIVLAARLEMQQIQLLFLPPYSPDLNPIEISYAYVKKTMQVIIIDYFGNLYLFLKSATDRSNPKSNGACNCEDISINHTISDEFVVFELLSWRD